VIGGENASTASGEVSPQGTRPVLRRSVLRAAGSHSNLFRGTSSNWMQSQMIADVVITHAFRAGATGASRRGWLDHRRLAIKGEHLLAEPFDCAAEAGATAPAG